VFTVSPKRVGSSDGVSSVAVGSSSYDMRYCFTRGNREVYAPNRLSRFLC
jgi:hypothetical protein